ncbi:1-(5-phosphoribosyl)-5-[(5-phosphoribosylamino)methylideneamino]imidazole-4-carboxamide isomerase [Falcatimonas sp. MSJ-15]|uniref:1-(5-phosphoribosyl)-5-[(5- phosphoribosylamino)methylideneamino]imidazole-4- carboxamide isomerase n=1 Tax=Falcatimonas sp. MSJ-15 TaxID=2841515 RepID=UPI001C110DE8|nr:1-(5-phosphoribosyl)-5-[(5-phosphoribosylamino)methylideneamino]imidazole-4-carboxamide isomerase [Falcatimonas sp. MSJ-15]MBU5470308.1 1-(5-phosphoribosyl)-5-[(5-phosphoribosylamino)methylideneamino]imidazole-4-carboxamide isomerase [Falcatimonas sp. MSJ-15]
MKLYPAIDIKNGQCVRLRQGKFDDVIIYSNNPVDIAKEWEACGASFIHLVDLDGALCGHAVNAEVIRKIASTVNIPVEVGGGIRNIKDIEDVFALGVSRVIIGTKAVENPNFIKEAVDKFGADKIVAGVDAKDGLVAIHGWEKVSNIKAVDLCMEMKKLGIKTIIYTDISKDGMLSGPNVYQTKLLSDQTGLDIIASGGVSGLKDLELVDEAGIHGAIIGKALYENKIDLRQAVAMFER